MTTEEKIAVMQAEVDGKKIELRNKKGGDWVITDQPLEWDWWTYDYRVAKEPREHYCNEYENRIGYVYRTAGEAVINQTSGAIRVVRFVEDMEYNHED